MLSSTGIVRSAFAMPPTPVVSCPISPCRMPEVFVVAARFHHAHAQLRADIRRALHRLALIVRQHHFERRAFRLDHALRKSADDLQALRIDIHQPQFA